MVWSVAQEIQLGTSVLNLYTMVWRATLLLVRVSWLSSVSSLWPFSAIDHVLAKARGVEAAIYKTMAGTTAEYKNKIRSLFVNLKDKANPGLRASIVEGSLTPEKLTKMSSQVWFHYFF